MSFLLNPFILGPSVPSPYTTAVGTATGSGAAAGAAASLAAAAAAAAAAGAALAAGASTAAATGTASGSGVASGSNEVPSDSVGSGDGSGGASGIGASVAAAVGTAAGAGSGSGVGARTAAAAGSASGSGVGAGDASVPPDGHRYWRVLFTADYGYGVSFSELEMYDGPYGKNVLSGGTLSASNYYSAQYEPQQLIDGELYHANYTPGYGRWLSGASGGTGEWVKYDFGDGNEKSIGAIGIHYREETGSLYFGPRSFDVQYSDDDSSWTTAWSVTDEPYWAGYEFRRYIDPAASPSYSGSPWGSHAYWRIFTQENRLDPYVIFHEAEFLDHAGGTDLASGGTAVSDSAYGGLPGTWPLSNAFDDDAGTRFVGGTNWGWQRYGFASPAAIGAVSITAANDGGNYNAAPRSLCVQFADDTSGPWTTTYQVLNEASWTDGEKRTFTDPAYV